jgi:hypothetical protein
MIARRGLVDLVPPKITPTWKNKRLEKEYIAKRLDRFLLSRYILDSTLMCKQWVGSGGDSDHHPIFLKVVPQPKKPTSPFKFNSSWLKDDEFIALVKEVWTPIDSSIGMQATIQMTTNLKRLKKETCQWARRKRKRED